MKKIEQLKIALQIVEAEEAGKPLEWEFKDPVSGWLIPTRDVEHYTYYEYEIRIKPWTLGREINGHTLPEGKEWHRQDFTPEMLPAPYRPLMLGETGSYELFSLGAWCDGTCPSLKCLSTSYHCRTARPIPKPSILTEEQKAAGWVEWNGGENPIPGKRCEYMTRRGFSTSRPSDDLEWSVDMESADIIAYRVVEPEWVDLGPEDILPCSFARRIETDDHCDLWTSILAVNSDVVVVGDVALTFQELREQCLINRSIALTGKWNPTAWEPCRKEQP